MHHAHRHRPWMHWHSFPSLLAFTRLRAVPAACSHSFNSIICEASQQREQSSLSVHSKLTVCAQADGAAGMVRSKTWQATTTFDRLTYYNHDTEPSRTDVQRRAFDWLAMAQQVREACAHVCICMDHTIVCACTKPVYATQASCAALSSVGPCLKTMCVRFSNQH